MKYYIVEEASNAQMSVFDDLEMAKQEVNNYIVGKYIVEDEEGNVLYDPQPGITYKI